ncbi:hypothetical protein D6C80_09079 [Aureobasidium pullulans]|nr:hypothetical protein D6C80_09079 [Aureobasidium pullulans]
MLLNTLLPWTLLAPAALAISIDTHLSTETTVFCSTTYGKTHLSSIPTTTSISPTTIELSPVILHNSTTLTKTVTPKPFNTLFSILTTKTKWVTSTPVNGTFYTTKTKFGTSTFWHHTTTTKTKTEFRYLTSRTTEWIAAPTGFMPVRNTTSAPAEEEGQQKRELSHPHAARASFKIPKPKVDGIWYYHQYCFHSFFSFFVGFFVLTFIDVGQGGDDGSRIGGPKYSGGINSCFDNIRIRSIDLWLFIYFISFRFCILNFWIRSIVRSIINLFYLLIHNPPTPPHRRKWHRNLPRPHNHNPLHNNLHLYRHFHFNHDTHPPRNHHYHIPLRLRYF